MLQMLRYFILNQSGASTDKNRLTRRQILKKPNKPNTLTYKLHDPCVQMAGRDIVINGRAADHVAAASRRESSHGRASLQKRRPVLLWWKQSRSSECCKLKGEKTQQGQKSKSGLLFSLPLLWGSREARCDFLNTANEKRLDFHRPADLLRAGVSQIQFQTFFFFSLSSTLPSCRYCRPIQVLIRI